MNEKKSELISSYQQYLPTILQADPMIGQFLQAFEKILSGLSETPSKEQIIRDDTQNLPGLEEIIDNIHTYFNPQETPEEFLPWLAGWVALSLRDDWEVEVKKAFIQQIVRLYSLRGTKAGLIEILSIYLKNSGFGEKVEVFDQFDNFPNYFQVQLTLKDRDPEKYWRQAKVAKAIIDREKPAQTFYSLKILVPTMQITKRSHVAYPFTLFALPQAQNFALEVTITPNEINSIQTNHLAEQLLVYIQGNSKLITLYSPAITINNQSFSVKQDLNYQHLQENLAGFNISLSNRTDKPFVGKLTIKIYFNINDREFTNILLEQPINLSPVLKICRQNNAGEIVEGNTILKQAGQSQQSGIKLTEYMWTKPDSFQVFEPPTVQKLQPNQIAIIDKVQLEAIVKITQPNTIKPDWLNKITVRLKDEFSDYYLLTSETIRENNQIIIKRTLYYQQFLQNIDGLVVTIKNLNNIEIVGKVSVKVYLTINQSLSNYELFDKNFTLAAVPPKDILQICRKNEKGEIISGETIRTILGTTSQSLS